MKLQLRGERGDDRYGVAPGRKFAALIFLQFINSALVPAETMPGPVRALAENQPGTSIVNAIDNLFTQQPVGADIWIALAWCVGILIVAYRFAMVTYRWQIS